MKRVNLLWIVGLILGWFFDFLFWKANLGINFAIFVALVLAGGFLVLALNGIKPSWRSLLLLVPILFFASITFLRLEGLTQFLAFAFTLGLMGLLTVSYLGGRWPLYSISDYIANFAKLLGSLVARPLIFRSEQQKAALAAGLVEETSSARKAGWKRFWAVFRGVLIALPVVVLFAALLSSADLVFAQGVNDLMKLFRLEKLPEYIIRVILILLGAYALMGAILHAAHKSQDEKLAGVDKPLIPPFLGFTEAAVVLGAVVLLFAAFVLVQFTYFFGGQTNIGLQGYTYSEYARRGFGELVAVAFISLLLFLGLSSIVRRGTSAQRWIFSGLGIGMVVLVGVILVSAFQRLLLYEAAFGFTRLRMYTHVFMIWLGAILAVVVVLEIARRERLFAMTALLASIGFAATLALINVDAVIVRQNVARVAQGQELDVPYLASLSSDAVPALVVEFQDSSLSAGTRDAVGAALFCRTQMNPDKNQKDWRSFSLSHGRAEKAIATVQSKLDQYGEMETQYPFKLTSPAGVTYTCYPEYSTSGD